VSREIFVDTLSVVAFLNERDTYHAKVIELTDVFENQPLVTTNAVLLEVGNALSRNGKASAIQIIEYPTESPEVEIVCLTPELFEQSFQLYRTYLDKQWGLVDCISFTVMRQREIEAALTFDGHFVQAGFTALMRS